ncbi:hypothetical protein FDA94_28860 [Herbidospora galbida]|uniref:Uncharacterized protein n=1 Tax=Herbidospora galbida TaxID=2575442 RepID=A0A4V5UYG4_9ACTN|nr:hypothetical protein [Herbidospora galbida]TKK84643.1 hypothetical protein FDA94_28860 [Herbidospora galbida]
MSIQFSNISAAINQSSGSRTGMFDVLARVVDTTIQNRQRNTEFERRNAEWDRRHKVATDTQLGKEIARHDRQKAITDYRNDSRYNANRREAVARTDERINEATRASKVKLALHRDMSDVDEAAKKRIGDDAASAAGKAAYAKEEGAARGKVVGENYRRSNLTAWDNQDRQREVDTHQQSMRLADEANRQKIRHHWDRVDSGMSVPKPGAHLPDWYDSPYGQPYNPPAAAPKAPASRARAGNVATPASVPQTAAPAPTPARTPKKTPPASGIAGAMAFLTDPSNYTDTPAATPPAAPATTKAAPARAQRKPSVAKAAPSASPPPVAASAAPAATPAAVQAPQVNQPAAAKSASPAPAPQGRAGNIRPLPRATDSPRGVYVPASENHEHVSARASWDKRSVAQRSMDRLPGERIPTREEDSARIKQRRGTTP